MYFQEEERDPFEVFGDVETIEDAPVQDVLEPESEPDVDEPAPETSDEIKTGFSWAGFAGGLAALVWIAAAIGGPLSYFGIAGVTAMDPAMQAGLIALAFGPALLFWVAASAAGEALKARRLATELTRMAYEARMPIEAGEAQAQRLSNTVKIEIESLNDAVAAALDRLGELELSAQRNAALFGDAVAASRESTESMSNVLQRERDALVELNGDLRGQTETMAHSIGRQVRMMREASKIVRTEVVAAEDALESHLAAFAASATEMGERTAAFHEVAHDAAAASTSLNETMSGMLEGLGEATRLTDAARQSAQQAVVAANETASAVRDTTRSAVTEAKRAAQLIRAETVALQDAALDTLAKLQAAANAAREASEESQAAADRHSAKIEQRLSALASTANARKTVTAARVAERVIERPAARPVERKPMEEQLQVMSLTAAANAAMSRGSSRAQVRADVEPRGESRQGATRGGFKGFGGWGNFLPQNVRGDDMPQAANEQSDACELIDFNTERKNPDLSLKDNALDLVTEAGVDLDVVLRPTDLDRIAQSSRHGAGARRRAVEDAAPVAVTRIARHLKRSSTAQSAAAAFRARPDLAKSENKDEGSDLVRAYLLIDAALA